MNILFLQRLFILVQSFHCYLWCMQPNRPSQEGRSLRIKHDHARSILYPTCGAPLGSYILYKGAKVIISESKNTIKALAISPNCTM